MWPIVTKDSLNKQWEIPLHCPFPLRAQPVLPGPGPWRWCSTSSCIWSPASLVPTSFCFSENGGAMISSGSQQRQLYLFSPDLPLRSQWRAFSGKVVEGWGSSPVFHWPSGGSWSKQMSPSLGLQQKCPTSHRGRLGTRSMGWACCGPQAPLGWLKNKYLSIYIWGRKSKSSLTHHVEAHDVACFPPARWLYVVRRH